MRGRIENFGDYNTLRIMLQEKNGDLSALIKEIKLDAFPKHFGITTLIVAPIAIGATVAAMKISEHIQIRRKLREKEFEDRLEATLEEDAQQADSVQKDEETPC